MSTVNIRRHIHENAIRQWNEAKDWATLLNRNKEFLQLSLKGRKNIATPYHIGPLGGDKMPFIPPLIQLHDFGLLVTGSAPAITTKPGKIGESKWSQLEQLPYLDFLVFYKGVTTDTFFDALLSDTRLLVRVTDFRPNTPVFLNGSCTNPTATTYKRETVSEERLLDMDWTAEIGWGLNPVLLQETFLSDMNAALTGNLLWCQVTSKEKADVVQLVNEHAANVGLRQ